jgi:putative membrane protein
VSRTEEIDEKGPGKSLAKGLVAGLIGGLVATAAKTIAESFYSPHPHGEPELEAALAERSAGRGLTKGEEAIAVETIHWGFGALTGAAYGALAEFYPAATAKDGAAFSMALASLTHEGALPAIGISAPPEEQSIGKRTGEMASYALFGVVTETVRRVVRKMLG